MRDVTRYLARKLTIYLLTFFVAVTIDWAIPRLMPGDPIDGLIARLQADPTAAQELHGYFTESFGLDQPLWKQYLNFWRGLLHGDLGPSIAYVGSSVSDLIRAAIPYTLALLVPAIVLSYIAGNRVGALAARRKVLDNTALPVAYVLTATPYVWLALVLAYVARVPAGDLPRLGRLRLLAAAGLDLGVRAQLPQPLVPAVPDPLPRLVRRLGDRDAEPDHLRARGRLRQLPPGARSAEQARAQVRLPERGAAADVGLALALGAVVGGALVTEIVFGYPGLGTLILTAIQNRDYFLLQGIFLFIIVGVLIANFIVDIAYVIVDPRTRTGLQGS